MQHGGGVLLQTGIGRYGRDDAGVGDTRAANGVGHLTETCRVREIAHAYDVIDNEAFRQDAASRDPEGSLADSIDWPKASGKLG
jgi:hypothetical protein